MTGLQVTNDHHKLKLTWRGWRALLARQAQHVIDAAYSTDEQEITKYWKILERHTP